MMKKVNILLLTILLAVFSYAQKAPDASVKFDTKITDVHLHELTGVPMIVTQGGLYGVNPKDGKIIWNFKESSFVKTLNVLGQGDDKPAFTEIPLSPYAKFSNTVFNVVNGKKIIDGKENNYKNILDYMPIIDRKAILFFTKDDKKSGKLFLVDVESGNVTWESTIKTNKNISSLLKKASQLRAITNLIQNKNQVAFSAGKTIFLVNKNDGKVVLSEKYDAGRLFFSEDDSVLIGVENKGSSLLGMATSAMKATITFGPIVIGKEVVAFDTQSGKEAWKKPIKLDKGFVNQQFEDGKLFLIHKDGAKFYDYKTGKKIWKKDFKKSRIKRIEKDDEGYMIYYKTRKILVDHKGKKIWRKAKKIIQNTDFDVDDDEEYTNFNYDKGVIFVTPSRIEYFAKDNKRRIYRIKLNEKSDKLTYDKNNKNLVVLSGKKLYILNPDKGLGKDDFKKIKFNDYSKISSLEIRENGYFINSNWEYVITDFKGNILKKEYFSQPGEGLRHLKNFGSFLAALGTAEITVGNSNQQSMAGSSSFVNQTNSTNSQSYHLSKHHKEFAAVSDYLYTPERYNAFKATKNSAFFYTKKNDKKVLVQVNKDTGDIIDTFEFGVNKPKYKIDEPSKNIFFRKGSELKIFTFK